MLTILEILGKLKKNYLKEWKIVESNLLVIFKENA